MILGVATELESLAMTLEEYRTYDIRRPITDANIGEVPSDPETYRWEIRRCDSSR